MKARKWQKAFFILLLLCVSARLFTGAAEAQVNFMAIVSDANQSQGLVQEVDQNSLGVFGPTIVDRRDASSIPNRHSEYKLYKKYVMPDNSLNIKENFSHAIEQIVVSIQATSYYIKDLTLRSLHSNSPPSPISPLFVFAFLCLFFIRIGDFGIHEKIKGNGYRRFGLQ